MSSAGIGILENPNPVAPKSLTGSRSDLGGKYLTFFLGEEESGIEILRVQEIIGMMRITPVPRTPAFIRGVINLRGKIISVVDLRLKFGMEFKEETPETCIVVVRVGHIEMGIVVDKVSEVTNITTNDIEAAPSFGTGVDTEYILGIGKSQGKVRLLLDVERILTDGELKRLQSAATEGGQAMA